MSSCITFKVNTILRVSFLSVHQSKFFCMSVIVTTIVSCTRPHRSGAFIILSLPWTSSHRQVNNRYLGPLPLPIDSCLFLKRRRDVCYVVSSKHGRLYHEWAWCGRAGSPTVGWKRESIRTYPSVKKRSCAEEPRHHAPSPSSYVYFKGAWPWQTWDFITKWIIPTTSCVVCFLASVKNIIQWRDLDTCNLFFSNPLENECKIFQINTLNLNNLVVFISQISH